MTDSAGRTRHLTAGLLLAAATAAQADVGFAVSFNDTSATYASYYSDIQRSIVAAGTDWISRLNLNVSTTLTVSVGFAAIPTANGASGVASFLTTANGINIYEQGAAHKVKTGIDDNGTAADIVFNIGINGYLQNELWFDPNPVSQAAVVPSTRTDARSVFLHEFGHAFGFNGWRDGSTGVLPGNYASTFDSYAALSQTTAGPTLYFTGPAATAVYGGPVPLTYANYGHVGNAAPRDGVNLVPDMMNGVVFYRGTRYQISALDLAVMQDIGLPVAAVPEPAAWVLMLGGLGLLLAQRHRRI